MSAILEEKHVDHTVKPAGATTTPMPWVNPRPDHIFIVGSKTEQYDERVREAKMEQIRHKLLHAMFGDVLDGEMAAVYADYSIQDLDVVLERIESGATDQVLDELGFDVKLDDQAKTTLANDYHMRQAAQAAGIPPAQAAELDKGYDTPDAH